MQDSPRWFVSAIDFSTYLKAACVLALIAAGFFGALAGDLGVLAAIGFAAIPVAMIALLAYPIRYAITDKHLVVRHGLITRRIPLRAIHDVRHASVWGSEAALAMDTLEINYRGGLVSTIRISPKQETEFFLELARAANLVVAGNRLHRR
jgi:hypothetical protein